MSEKIDCITGSEVIADAVSLTRWSNLIESKALDRSGFRACDRLGLVLIADDSDKLEAPIPSARTSTMHSLMSSLSLDLDIFMLSAYSVITARSRKGWKLLIRYGSDTCYDRKSAVIRSVAKKEQLFAADL